MNDNSKKTVVGRTDGNQNIKYLFELLRKGEEEIILSDKHKDIVLILGNTGSGKSTFTQWVTGNGALKAKEITEGTGEFVIEDDKNKISSSTVQSKTIFPELVVDARTNTAYYDCPGFSDTRSTSNDISTTFFIKKVLDHATSIKMIFVVNHHSLRKGIDRKDFMELLRHVTDLINDIDKFKYSIALVATKVDNQYIKKRKQLVLVDDNKVVSSITDFLLEVKHDLKDRLKVENISPKEKIFLENATKLIDAILLKNETSSKIGIFRRPEESGPVNEISLLRMEREIINKIINEKIQFTSVSNADFGYTISDSSRNAINKFKDEINDSIWTSLRQLAELLNKDYHELVKNIRSKIKPISSIRSDILNFTEAEIYSRKFKTNQFISSNILEEFKDLKDPEELSKKIDNLLSAMHVVVPRDIITNIESKGRYFNFLQIFSSEKLGTRPWIDLFKYFPAYLNESQRIIQDDVNHVTADVTQLIRTHFNFTARAIREQYFKQTKLLDIENVPGILIHDYSLLFNMTEKIKKQNTTVKLLTTIINEAERLHIYLPRKNIEEAARLGKYFEYLHILGDQKLSIDCFGAFRAFKDTTEYLYDSIKWYNFLNDLYIKFSTYSIQKDRRRFNVANIEDFGKDNKETGLFINEKNFRQFLLKLNQFQINEIPYITSIEMSDSRWEELNHVLNLTIKHKTILSCSESTISIRGSYISVNDIYHNFIEYHDGSCNKYMEKLITTKYISFHLFALNSLFIDTDVDGLYATTKIISPRWQVIGKRKLVFEGLKGLSQVRSKQFSSPLIRIHWNTTKLKAKNGSYPGGRGHDGKPGGAGWPGPTFFGIGSTFINGENLKIINKGGDGGSGEDGGDGYVGKNGMSFSESMTNNLYCGPVCPTISGFDCQHIQYYRRAAQYNAYGAVGSYKPEVLSCTYKIFGNSGEKGGDGGNGGKGGRGGPSGRTILFELGNKSGVVKEFYDGHEGNCGKGGTGGAGGYDADDIILDYHNNQWSRQLLSHYKQNLSGKNGRDCANARNMEIPNPPMELEITEVLQEYKRYSRQNMKDRYKRAYLLAFYKELQNYNNVRNAYSVLDLTNEFQELEEEYFELNKFLDLIPIYQSLLDKIIDRSKKIKIIEKSITTRNEHKKVLAHLYAVILSKIYNLKENPKFDLVIDVNKYLDLLKTDIENFRNTQKVNNKLDSINNIKLNYKISIDKKLEEAKMLIESHVLPEINRVSEEIDEKIEILIQQTLELEEKTAQQTIELIKKKEKLKETLQMRGLFSGLKLIGQMLSFLGPIGVVAGTVIESTLSESLILDDTADETKTFELPESVKSASRALKTQITAFTNVKINNFDTMIGDILLETEKYPKVLNDTSAKILEIRNMAKKFDKKKLHERVGQLGDELKSELKKKASILKASSDQKSKKALAVVKKLGKAVQTIDMGIDIYNKYKHDDSKLNAINEAIRQSKNNFQKLKQFEENIYNTISPMLENMEKNLEQISNELITKSRVSLDVTKWQVQSSLRDIKLIITKLVQGFRNVEDKLPRCLEKIEETMTTLIIIYDRIQNYKEQQNLANFIADINSPVASNIQITDGQLIAAVNRLEMSLRSNIILQQSKIALNAFKQFVFPFSHFYLEEFVFPGDLTSVKNLDNLITQIVMQIENMKSKIDLYKISIKKYDRYIHISQFNSKYISTRPFYIWKNSEFKQSMSEMLSGREIILKADIKHSASDKDAIKFNSISFNFKTHNDTTQRELDNILRGFKISATHFGNSYYKFNHTIYLIVSGSQNIEYSIEKDQEGHPVDKNVVYDKIQKGDLTLSPYALWKIQLINATDNILFDRLKSYEDKIDLELVGTGSYLSSVDENFNLNTNDYYKPDDTCNNFEDIIRPEFSTWEESSSQGRYIRSNAIQNLNNEEDYHSTSAANTAAGFLPINYVCHFFTQNISKFTKMCVEQLNSWFLNSEGGSAEKITYPSVIDNDGISNDFNFVGAFHSRIESELKSIASKFIGGEHQVNNINTYEFFDIQSNLLLLNIIFHKKNNTRFKNLNNVSVDNSHKLAYNAYTSNCI